ncbi:2-hydroxyglutaryl-CoA dehydratase, D-component [Fusobacterium necrophorum subsp. funduliforme ATCC 51357]|uniref:2-hydroxyglutaryl-CoA dehydratase n=2 Tax=Fusobacterium necrophorum TaxID=859 RepID=A0A162J3V0_9FUSO|nr:2-hydroxyacyl-CoA dehydratase subunit D [Fusobacterium necrophorum]AYV93404.1 2-hydroxyacyl-CoA dehydratase subunit D [Fusobacterium necrophorum subsp. funduliforme]AYZ74383.1 2-hydroxyacyl-CoA dehydratase subunit D [Fusobacterium necrophorum]AZW09731.1 2-hydroxyacyl-CoA dehydratase subunit D [Fusobacterium necrophorum subsp. necrophorum]EIJ67404.1 2-hydroxyglutaryl-CoA dehydratase, D-component [Fusobacterium necrophorum subsp. funduliforme ATCC 51357]KAB0552132.1 2-hydroxyacyl-CoA dehydrat
MEEIKELLEQFKYYANNPRKQLDKYLAEGKKAVGIFPYYAPEEIVYAAGVVPFGVWGGQGPIERAKEYFPTFYYSMALRCLEMALDGTLDGLSASMVTTLDDTLRPFSQNYKVSAGRKIPMIFLNHGQHRKEDFGKQYNARIFKKAKEELEKICDVKVTDENLKKAFEIYNENRSEKRKFIKLAATHPQTVKASDRCHVLKSSYFMLKDEHTALLKKLNEKLAALAEEAWDGVRVVTSGVITDNPGLLEVFDAYKVCIVADDVAHESRALKVDIDLSIEDPMLALADQFARMDEDPILYDPDIFKRPKYVVDLAKENNADGCLLFMMNFNDTEEMEYPSLKQAFDAAKIPLIKMGYDQQMVDFGQVKTQLETFNEIVQLNRM